jgi:hypothetical protein
MLDEMMTLTNQKYMKWGVQKLVQGGIERVKAESFTVPKAKTTINLVPSYVQDTQRLLA